MDFYGECFFIFLTKGKKKKGKKTKGKR